MKYISVCVCFVLLITTASAQVVVLPTKEWNSTAANHFVFYMSGDGGFNQFSNGLCTAINKAGYSVIAVNTRAYFWSRKTPEEATADVAACLLKQLAKKGNSQFILAGYSFGADIVPFITNRLSGTIKKKLLSVILISPSTSTNFEIHLLDMLGRKEKQNLDVVAEINRMGLQKTAIILGSEENEFPLKAVTLKNSRNEFIPGGHHFDDNPEQVAKIMLKYFK